jgi:hypothetical protein
MRVALGTVRRENLVTGSKGMICHKKHFTADEIDGSSFGILHSGHIVIQNVEARYDDFVSGAAPPLLWR